MTQIKKTKTNPKKLDKHFKNPPQKEFIPIKTEQKRYCVSCGVSLNLDEEIRLCSQCDNHNEIYNWDDEKLIDRKEDIISELTKGQNLS